MQSIPKKSVMRSCLSSDVLFGLFEFEDVCLGRLQEDFTI